MKEVLEELTFQVVQEDDEYYILMTTPIGAMRSPNLSCNKARQILLAVGKTVIEHFGKGNFNLLNNMN